MAEASVVDSGTLARWDGGVSPYGVDNKKLGMWLFIVSDSLTFGALLFAYSYTRLSSSHWPTPFDIWPGIAFSTLMTFCLLTSSLTMVLAVHNANAGHPEKVPFWIGLTMLFGLAFVGLHMKEWFHLIHEGVTLTKNPWGDPMFGGTFFTITGLHMFHVFSGVCYLGVVALKVKGRKLGAIDVEVAGLYWHFVDLVWMFVFPLIYLMSVNMGGAH